MPYTIALPPLHTPPLRQAPVIPVIETGSGECAEQPQLQGPSLEQFRQLRSKFQEMTLAEFATQGHALHVRVPWWPESLWFVPSSVEATILSQEGISRGRIWTANELRDLVEMGDVTQKELRTLIQIKREFGAEFTRFRRTKEPSEDRHASQAMPNRLQNLWPLEIPGLGKSTVGSFTPCERCGEGTWTSYGGVPFCRRHAIAEATRRKAADDPT